ncbi:VOC family protein [Herbiconiux sp. VKM Ac-1786]|uniref:VOC family protein n=1 Tax=Herbiconiux sp. VKM Ac-1786 TaxID=2783824 RepID=UPI00188A9A61|nr:VOC family protein [Herbiconiux sp. VKM Ac-1786]MBF4571869.1 VOC family protein [Herbiconiux sp. VKM Ac-1786]
MESIITNPVTSATAPTATSTVRVNTIGYVAFDTPDVERLTEYYTSALGFTLVDGDGRSAYLSADGSNHAVVLNQADEARARARVGYRVDGSLDDAATRLTRAGYQVERRTDVSPTETTVLALAEPQTGMPIHLYDSSVEIARPGTDAVAPTKLGHVAAYVPSLDAMQSFYEELLGFQWSDTIGDFFVFMRCNTDHHAANFMKSDKYSGMHHVAYEMRDLTHLQNMLDHLASREVRLEWGPGRHGPGHNIFTYHRDPDGNVIELFTQLDVMDDATGNYEPRPWHDGVLQYPRTWEADLKAQNSWGPGNPAMRDR